MNKKGLGKNIVVLLMMAITALAAFSAFSVAAPNVDAGNPCEHLAVDVACLNSDDRVVVHPSTDKARLNLEAQGWEFLAKVCAGNQLCSLDKALSCMGKCVGPTEGNGGGLDCSDDPARVCTCPDGTGDEAKCVKCKIGEDRCNDGDMWICPQLAVTAVETNV